MTQATTKDYWISPSALYIELNALGNPDYIQASCVSGAQILVYVTNIISYDAGHNYRRWSLQASPTVFNDHTAKYVYAAIPRDMSSTKPALLVFPSEEVDIYGKNASEEQIGTEDYYYIFLQGIISSSGDNGTTNRDWTQRISTGYLSSDEAIDASTSESAWFKYSSVDQVTTFLKDLTQKVGTKFRELYAKTLTVVSGGFLTFEDGDRKITGITGAETPIADNDKIVTPDYMTDKSLSRLNNDTARGLITFMKGLQIGDSYGIDENGKATLYSVILDLLKSVDYDYSSQSGFGFTKREDGKYKLSLTDLEIWGKAIFHELEIRKLSYVGGNYIFSPAGSKIEYVKTGTATIAWNKYRCYFLADDGTTATSNMWKVGDLALCEAFDVKTGTATAVSNKRYWRKVIAVSTDNEQITDDDGNILFGGQKFGYVDLSMMTGEYESGSDQPAAGDTIVCVGNVSDTDRQSIIEIMTVGDIAPALLQYSGINTFALPVPDVRLSKKAGNLFTGDFYSTSGKSITEAMSEATEAANGAVESISEIKQTVDGISLKVTQTEVRDRNIIANSYLNLASTLYGFAVRDFTLEAGKTYTLSAKGKVKTGGELRIFVYREDSAGTWTWSKYLSIMAEEESRASVTFADVPETGTYHVTCYSYPQTSGVAVFVRYIQLEEGKEATAWSMNANDPAVNGNLLPDINGNIPDSSDSAWVMDGVDKTEGAKLPDGGTYTIYHKKNTGTEAEYMAYVEDGCIDIGNGTSYTLSFWAKGTGKITSRISSSVLSVLTCDGTEGDDAEFTLSSDWKRFWATFSTNRDDEGNDTTFTVIEAAAGAEVWATGFKLEPYGRCTAYSADGVTTDALLGTGIDITNRKIEVTADQFTIQNNQGEQTFDVNADGLVTMNHIAIGGMINKFPVDITAGNFDTLFDSEQELVTQTWIAKPKISQFYGIYYFTASTGKSPSGTPLTLNMPSAYVNPDGNFTGDVFDEDGNLSVALLRSVRALVGNTVQIYNDSADDICVTGMSPYFEDVWVTSTASKVVTKSAASGTTPSSGGVASDATSGLEKSSDTGDINPDQRYAGRKRNEMTVTLKGGKHQFVSLQCVCEVGSMGWENIYWLVNYGQGLNT